ncbi:MAG: rRNA pseudouridine synthase [Candidatus Omnitrophica bacterium]|nr:rRNA pseudouridine synthase [Candidatus Omnitrophota bacterium]
MEAQRLNVFLAHQGVCSRRKAMDLITAGHVSVNGRVVREPSTPVEFPKDRVAVDGKVVQKKSYEYIMLNKPEGYVTTREDRFAQKTVLDLLPTGLRHLNPVGRLDKNTEGLLIMTNDGELANQLTHPRYDVDKTYVVQIQKKLGPEEQKKLEKGIVIDGEKTAPAKIAELKALKNGCEFLITIHEGRKRQIRLMLAEVGHYVTFLKRIQQGPLTLGALPTGGHRMLTPDEISALKKEK